MGSKEKVFRAGSEMQLVCTIRDVTAVPTFVFWYHNSRMINYDAVSGVEVAVTALERRRLRATLTVASVSSSSSGNYSCSPSLVSRLMNYSCSPSLVSRLQHRKKNTTKMNKK